MRIEPPLMDFFDLKGILEQLAHGLHVGTLMFKPTENSTFHPGRCAAIYLHSKQIGVAGELHPLVRKVVVKWHTVCTFVRVERDRRDDGACPSRLDSWASTK